MNNEKKEFFNNVVEVNVSEEEIVLAPPTQLFDEATDIAQNTSSDEKLPFTLKYDANKKEFLLSILKTAGAIVEYDDEEEHTLSTMMNMTQLAFIKRLDCVERVKAEKKTNPFLDDEMKNSNMVNKEVADLTEFNAAAQTMSLSIDESSEVSVVSEEGSVSANIATTSISGDSANSTMQTAKEIEVEEVVYGCICCPGAGQWFKFTAPKTATYTIYTTGSLDTIGALYDSSGKQITCVDDRDECGELNFRIIRSLNANTLYYIRVSEAISNTGSYRLQVTEKTLVDSISISPSTIILEKGKTYELPMEPDTFVNIDGAEQLSNLSATTVPATADEKRVFWDCLDNDVISITTDWHNGQKYQTITAIKAGTATLYAYDWKSHGKKGVCTVTVLPYCGGSEYRDVTLHSFVLQDDNYYVCSKCGYRIKSPALQDKEILSEEDYRIVTSCYTAIPYYAKIDKEDEGNYSIKSTALRIAIDDIRSKSEYCKKYEYVGSDGIYHRNTIGNENDSYGINMTIRCDVIDNDFELILNNGFVSGLAELFTGWAIPSQYQYLFFDLTDVYTNLTDFLCGLAASVGYKEISIILKLILFAASIDDKMAINDKIVRIEFLHGHIVYTSVTDFDSNGNYKLQRHSVC